MCSWVLAGIVLLAAAAVWSSQRLDGGSLTLCDVFPLLGLGAFGLMWTHYVLGSLRRVLGLEKKVNEVYFQVSSALVLLLIVLHPAILIAQLYKDGFGLPPESYLSAYPKDRLAIGLGTIALVTFLIFECKKRFHKKSWWRFVEWAQLAAMVLIFFHGLSLGRELSVGWYRAVWYVYGITFILAVMYNSWYDGNINKRSVDERS